ncbi:11798_t:CDS:2 [Acaulospora colombiana]|uniref:11798_t:CDS:1 n=1 Tax=Acaulospora colombiana TaxID=27376 RepID=A0ACA9M6A0_9GLOM|nr:11798_t:CDS:2 [Acaulospora colombiana]
MSSIEVTYNKTSRRLAISQTTTWSTLEAKLHSLFNVPTSKSILLSYTDEDDDVITLSTDIELFEVISAQEYDDERSDNDAFLKFALIVPSNRGDLGHEDNSSWIFGGTTAHAKEGWVSLTNGDGDDSEYENNVPCDDSSENGPMTPEFVMTEEPIFEPTVSTGYVSGGTQRDEKRKLQIESNTLQHKTIDNKTCSLTNSSQNKGQSSKIGLELIRLHERLELCQCDFHCRWNRSSGEGNDESENNNIGESSSVEGEPGWLKAR